MTGVVSAADLAPVVDALRGGAVVGIPTDTVYGLAVDPSRAGSTNALYLLKGRPAALALPVLVADVDQADALVPGGALPAPARRLAERFWPGALTVVVARRPDLEWDLGGDRTTIGLRCPAHAVARELCRRVGALATTSANHHGHPPLVTAEDVTGAFGATLMVIDGGRCEAPPSTVVDATVTPPRCLRAGSLSWEDVLAVAG